MSKFFRPARADKVTRYYTPDGNDWIELRAELSKAEANLILGRSPSGERDIEGGLAFYEYFFQRTIKGWSMTDDEGSAVLPTVDAYRALEASAARWIDEQLTTHIGLTIGAKVEEVEGKSSESLTTLPSDTSPADSSLTKV